MTLDKCFQLNLTDALARLPGPQGEHSVLLFEHGSMRIKLYAPRGTDTQTPHSQDEIYVIAQGKGEFVCAGARQPFGPHEVLFAAAGVEHRFEDVTDDFAVWVVFYGPEGGEVDQS